MRHALPPGRAALAAALALCAGGALPGTEDAAAAGRPPSDYRLTLDWASLRALASGSDNWPMTWAADGRVYTIWGDGGGFTARNPYVSLGLGALTGTTAATIRGTSLVGGHEPSLAPCVPLLRHTLPEDRFWAGCQGQAHAKSYGMLALDDELFVWTQPGSCRPEYGNAALHRNRLGTNRWTSADWKLTGLFSPTFAQKGKNHAASGGFVHVYAVRIDIREQDARCLSVMGTPVGEVVLARAWKGADLLAERSWRWWDGRGWGDGRVKASVFKDHRGIGPKISVTYLPGLRRYILVTEVGDSAGGLLAFHESFQPQGPWRRLGEGRFPGTTFLATIVPSSVRDGGRRFTVAFTGGQKHDALNLVDARLEPRR